MIELELKHISSFFHTGTVRCPQKRRAYFDFFKQLVTRPENMQNKRGELLLFSLTHRKKKILSILPSVFSHCGIYCTSFATGVTGTNISLQTNYITVNVDNHDKLFLSRVDFTPSYIYGTRKWKALRKFTEDPCVGLDINKDCVFDGENLLYCKPSGFKKLGDVSIPLFDTCNVRVQ